MPGISLALSPSLHKYGTGCNLYLPRFCTAQHAAAVAPLAALVVSCTQLDTIRCNGVLRSALRNSREVFDGGEETGRKRDKTIARNCQ